MPKDSAELARHNKLQSIGIRRLVGELQEALGREPTEGELADAITNGFGAYFSEVDDDLNIWGTGEENGFDPRAMEPTVALDALERHYQRFCPEPKSPIPLRTCEDST